MAPTFSIQWHLTTKCEQRCTHCYLYNSQEAATEIAGEQLITWSKLKKIVNDLLTTCERLQATPRIALTGGNPLLHKYFWNILGYIKEKGIRVHIMGNPFDITDELAQSLLMQGVSKFQLSLDGLEGTHDEFRKPGSYAATETACKTLSRNGIQVAIMTTVSKLNMHEIPLLAEKVVEMGASAYAFARFCPANGDDSAMPTPMEYRAFLGQMWEAFQRLDGRGTKFILKDHLWTLFLHEIGLFDPKPTNGMIIDGCGVGISHLTVLADGTVYACRRFKSPLGKVPEQSLYDLFLSEEMDAYRQVEKMEKCGTCTLLPYCRGCMAVTHSLTGNWKSADPQCWK